MEYITKKDLIDCSTPDEFCFSLCCMECKTVWKSTPIRFSKAGKKPENENRKIIYDTLYDREKNLAFQKALNQAKEIFNICPICKRLVWVDITRFQTKPKLPHGTEKSTKQFQRCKMVHRGRYKRLL